MVSKTGALISYNSFITLITADTGHFTGQFFSYPLTAERGCKISALVRRKCGVDSCTTVVG